MLRNIRKPLNVLVFFADQSGSIDNLGLLDD